MLTISERDRKGNFTITVENNGNQSVVAQQRSMENTLSLTFSEQQGNNTIYRAWRQQFAGQSIITQGGHLDKSDTQAFLKAFNLPTDAGLRVSIAPPNEAGQTIIKVNGNGTDVKFGPEHIKAFAGDAAKNAALMPGIGDSRNIIASKYPGTPTVETPAKVEAPPKEAVTTPATEPARTTTLETAPEGAKAHKPTVVSFEAGHDTLKAILKTETPGTSTLSVALESKKLPGTTWLGAFAANQRLETASIHNESGKQFTYGTQVSKDVVNALGLPPSENGYSIKITATQTESSFNAGQVLGYRETLTITDHSGKLTEADQQRVLSRLVEMDQNGIKPLPPGMRQAMLDTMPSLQVHSVGKDGVRIGASAVQRPTPHAIDLAFDAETGTYILKVHAPKADAQLDGMLAATNEIRDHLKANGLRADKMEDYVPAAVREGKRSGFGTTSDTAHRSYIGCLEFPRGTSAQQVLDTLAKGTNPIISPETVQQTLGQLEKTVPADVPVRNKIAQPQQQQQGMHHQTAEQRAAQAHPSPAQTLEAAHTLSPKGPQQQQYYPASAQPGGARFDIAAAQQRQQQMYAERFGQQQQTYYSASHQQQQLEQQLQGKPYTAPEVAHAQTAQAAAHAETPHAKAPAPHVHAPAMQSVRGGIVTAAITAPIVMTFAAVGGANAKEVVNAGLDTLPTVGGNHAMLEGNYREARVQYAVEAATAIGTGIGAVGGGGIGFVAGTAAFPVAGNAAGMAGGAVAGGAIVGTIVNTVTDESMRLWNRHALGFKDVRPSKGELLVTGLINEATHLYELATAEPTPTAPAVDATPVPVLPTYAQQAVAAMYNVKDTMQHTDNRTATAYTPPQPQRTRENGIT